MIYCGASAYGDFGPNLFHERLRLVRGRFCHVKKGLLISFLHERWTADNCYMRATRAIQKLHLKTFTSEIQLFYAYRWLSISIDTL